ncbi:M13 family peptidase, partial [Xanthomonas oryzae pv. oryzae]
KGALVDAKGELRNWWTPAEKASWTMLTDKVATQFSAYPYPGVPNAKVNGAQTAEENLADLAGVELAWQAFSKAQPAATEADKQAFFTAWAGLWAQQLSPNEAVQRASADIRAPGQWRTNGPLSNLPEFGAVFSCKAGQPMQRVDADQIKLWR